MKKTSTASQMKMSGLAASAAGLVLVAVTKSQTVEDVETIWRWAWEMHRTDPVEMPGKREVSPRLVSVNSTNAGRFGLIVVMCVSDWPGFTKYVREHSWASQLPEKPSFTTICQRKHHAVAWLEEKFGGALPWLVDLREHGLWVAKDVEAWVDSTEDCPTVALALAHPSLKGSSW